MDVHVIARSCELFLHYDSRASGCLFAFAEHPHEMGSKKGNVKRRRKIRRPQVIERMAPRAGLEPATLRLTGQCRCDFSVVLRWFSPCEDLLIPGVREGIVHGLFTGLARSALPRGDVSPHQPVPPGTAVNQRDAAPMAEMPRVRHTNAERDRHYGIGSDAPRCAAQPVQRLMFASLGRGMVTPGYTKAFDVFAKWVKREYSSGPPSPLRLRRAGWTRNRWRRA